MRILKPDAFVFLFAIVVTASLASDIRAQGSGSSRISPAKPPRRATLQDFARDFWSHMVDAKSPYNRWKNPWRRNTESPVESPHGNAGKAIFVNPIADRDLNKLAPGSVLVLEDYDQDKKRTSISVMYRVAGSDSTHQDWYWLRYLENGALDQIQTEQGVRPAAGRLASCIECHGKAGGHDYIFGNDVAPTEEKGSAE